MKYKVSGSLEIKFPEGVELVAHGDNEQEAVASLLEELIDNGELWGITNDDNLVIKAIRKVFTIKVVETFTNEVEIDSGDYDDIEDEQDAERYVRNNLEEFRDDFDYDYYTSDGADVECTESRELED